MQLFALIIVMMFGNSIDVEVSTFKKMEQCLAVQAELDEAVLSKCVRKSDGWWKYSVMLVEPEPEPDPDPVPDPDPIPEPSACESTVGSYDASDFDTVLENFEQTETLKIQGHEWDNTLIRGCFIHDTGGDGIYIRDVTNVVVTGCEIARTGSSESDRGIKLSGYGSTSNVVLDGNYVHDIPKSGIYSSEYPSRGTDHPGLKVLNNRIEDIGLVVGSNAHHPIYLQSSDARIEGNQIAGQRGGNGISVRSSGVVRCNNVSGTSLSSRPGIRYYSNHAAGESNLLLIENNTIVDDNVGINIYKPVETAEAGDPPPDHVVKNFIIRGNVISAPEKIVVDSAYDDPIYSVTVE